MNLLIELIPCYVTFPEPLAAVPAGQYALSSWVESKEAIRIRFLDHIGQIIMLDAPQSFYETNGIKLGVPNYRNN